MKSSILFKHEMSNAQKSDSREKIVYKLCSGLIKLQLIMSKKHSKNEAQVLSKKEAELDWKILISAQ